MKKHLFNIQDDLYQFPYHYIPSIDNDGRGIRIHRTLNWGLDYITYLSFIENKIRSVQPKSLIDIGCGDGRLISLINNYVPNICGIDLSSQAIQFAKAFNPSIKFVCDDISCIDEKFEMGCLIEVLEHIPDDEVMEFIAQVYRVISIDGKLLISVPTTNAPLNKKHYRHYTQGLLSTTLESYFKIEQIWWIYKSNLLERLLRACLCNPLFVTNSASIRNLIWRLHKNYTYNADKTNGYHIVCIAQPV
jgi:2-polyprenyl-3-methyl-5-hydroxy-6-metoxy-1,4-benzoquinol methylase